MGTKGFSGIQSILYHHHPPTRIEKLEGVISLNREEEDPGILRHRHFRTEEAARGGDPITSRQMLMANKDVALGISLPEKPMNYFYRNGEGDELLFVHVGQGRIETPFGILDYRAGDYIVVPTGTTYRIVMESKDTRFFIIESNSSVTFPRRYRNEFGQLLEHSPYCERDIHVPVKLETYDAKQEVEVRVKARGQLHCYRYEHHPLDVVGWDGYLYPYVLSIHDFEPITGRLHMPPPIHQTFEGKNFVVCSFVPRLYDYHPQAIPAPYFHSNVESDEVLYYVNGNFMSRKGISESSLTLHPAGVPHGPHPGKVEASIGKKESLELAVMVDTFRPLKVLKAAHPFEDEQYIYSWKEE